MKELEFFEIDKDRLDEEWVNHVKTFHKLAIVSADAREELERAKANEEMVKDELKAVVAELDLDIRSNPSKYGLEKVTEGAIEKVVILQSKHAKAQKKVYKARQQCIKAQHDSNVADAAVKTMDHKKKALEDLVTLQGRDYFSSPRLSGEAGKEMVEKERREIRSSRSVR